MEIVLAILIGYIIGLFQNGIHIHMAPPLSKRKENEYNKAPIDTIPDDVREYVERNKGFLRF